MQGKRQDHSEFTIERGREKGAGTDRSSPRGASSAPQGERQSGQAEFDLGGETGRQSESGIPERLRRKYYVAEVGPGDEAKAYADPRGEYLAFKVSTDRMATRLEDAGIVRDMVSVAQHRGWKEVEVRGSEEFRRTAWLEASVRGLSVRGYEPDPVDRAAFAFRAKPDIRSTRTAEQSQAREAGASETMTVDGVATRRPIDVTVMPPERRQGPRQEIGDPGASTSHRPRAHHAFMSAESYAAEKPTITIDFTPLRAAAAELPPRTGGQWRADAFRSGAHRQQDGDDVVRAARSQFAAIERALNKSITDAALRRSVLAYAKEQIAEHLQRGREFKHAKLGEHARHRRFSSDDPQPGRGERSKRLEDPREH